MATSSLGDEAHSNFSQSGHRSSPSKPSRLSQTPPPESSDRSAAPQYQYSSSQRTGGTSKSARQHVVGQHGRLGGARNTSVGKNMNKLGKIQQLGFTPLVDQGRAPTGDGSGGVKFARGTKEHGRSTSGSSVTQAQATGPSSPRPELKRNKSSAGMPRNVSYTALKKNFSSGALVGKQAAAAHRSGPRVTSKSAKRRSADYSRAATAHATDDGKNAKSSKHRATDSSDFLPGNAQFELGQEDTVEQDDGWEDHSGTQSPANTTRPTTQGNPSILPSEGASVDASQADLSQFKTEGTIRSPLIQVQSASTPRQSINRPNITPQPQPSRGFDPEVVSNLLLSRHSNPNLASAEAANGSSLPSRGPQVASQGHAAMGISQASITQPNSGGEVVSRFLNSDGRPGSESPYASVVTSQRITPGASGNAEIAASDGANGQASLGPPNQARAPVSPNSESTATTPDTVGANDRERSLDLAVRSTPHSVDSDASTATTENGETKRSDVSRSHFHFPNTDPVSNRTQQKLWLQRLASAVDISAPDEDEPPQQNLHSNRDQQSNHQASNQPDSGAGVRSGSRFGNIVLFPSHEFSSGASSAQGARMAQREVARQMEEAMTQFEGVTRFRDPVREAATRLRARGLLGNKPARKTARGGVGGSGIASAPVTPARPSFESTASTTRTPNLAQQGFVTSPGGPRSGGGSARVTFEIPRGEQIQEGDELGGSGIGLMGNIQTSSTSTMSGTHSSLLSNGESGGGGMMSSKAKREAIMRRMWDMEAF